VPPFAPLLQIFAHLPCCPTVCGLPLSLVSAGRLAELVSHHLSREVVEIQHVLEERIFRDFILWEWWEVETKREHVRQDNSPNLATNYPLSKPQFLQL
jgi:hypothetical protein